MSATWIDAEIEELLRRVGNGDTLARQELLLRHRDRLRRMIEVRFDRRLAPRLDPSDVVQEALADAAQGLDSYLARPPLPFYPWLRQFAWERLVKMYERHVKAGRRSVNREETLRLSGGSVARLAAQLVSNFTSPSGRVLRDERRELVLDALENLKACDREVLALRYLEGLTNAETAAVLGIGEGAVKMRHLRALERLRLRLSEGPLGNDDEQS
jgi:RNA polymerase sigma-70 factor (ECF subfamily)